MKRRNVTILMICILVIALVGCSAPTKKQFFNITTGGTGGTYYPVGGALADVLSTNIDGLTVTAQAGNASVGNVNLLSNHETESAFVQNNVAFWAYEGEASFKDKPVENLRGIASLYPEAIQIVALKDSGITSVDDLRGKKVSVGEQGSGVEVDVKNIIEAHNLTYDDMNIDYLSFTEAAQKLKDKQIDVAFVTAGYPTSSIMDVSKSRDIVIVSIADDKIDAMIEKSPYYAKTTIPANTYDGQVDPVNTATTMAMWVCDAEADEDLVYNMTKALWENRAKLEETHDKGKDITLDTALDGMAIPLHPGAEKYYKEQGIIK